MFASMIEEAALTSTVRPYDFFLAFRSLRYS
jgi:hypothetical protein